LFDQTPSETMGSRPGWLRRLTGDRARRSWAAGAIVLAVLGVIGTFLGAHTVANTDASRARLNFRLQSEEIASALTLAIQHEEDLVVSARAAIAYAAPGEESTRFNQWGSAVEPLNRYPELLDVGLIVRVPRAGLTWFAAHMVSHPVLPLARQPAPYRGAFTALPTGSRSYYCFAVSAFVRSRIATVPPGLDYCALEPGLLGAIDSGLTIYAPFREGSMTTLGVETPVYRGGRAPATAAARRRAFIGWMAESFDPHTLLLMALRGHPHMAVTFHYRSGTSNVAFSSGTIERHARTATVSLHNDWTVESYASPLGTGIFGAEHAFVLLLGGTLLSVLMGILLFVIGTGRNRALALVNEKTRELSYQALHDTLTGLPNRALVFDRAEQLLARAARDPSLVPAVLFVDVDSFKSVNDTFGHAAGDQLLRVIAERLRSTIREHDTVGRLSGDEFVVLLESATAEAPPELIAQRLTEILRQPVELDSRGTMISISVSIGAAIGTRPSADGLLRDADLALYGAKATGKDRYVFFEEGMQSVAESRQTLADDLGQAIREHEFFLLYQPIFDLQSHRVAGVEALIRWQHPTRGVIEPEDFIPLAESTGQISAVGRWVLQEACRQSAEWEARGHATAISVNISAQQLDSDDLIADVEGALVLSGIDPHLLTLEITETALMRDAEAAAGRLKALRALGVRIAIDDFGTGYSSLAYLRQFAPDALKIDRSFIGGITHSRESAAIMKTLVSLGKALGIETLAEGIEEPAQLKRLERECCDQGQGFLLARPLDVAAVDRLLELTPVGGQTPNRTVSV
jgi:diguanylate cyclase (GGDEF)-like protein